MFFAAVVVMGFIVGILVGLMGIGGGVVLVPAMVYLLGMDQHMAQGTSLFLQLPPLGLGALLVYWRKGRVDLGAGVMCALGFLLGGFSGSKIAIGMNSRNLTGAFGIFLITAAILLWFKNRPIPERTELVLESHDVEKIMESPAAGEGEKSSWQKDYRGMWLALILFVACGVGVCSGLFGVGGGVILVPLLALVFNFDQHTAQGTSLAALVPPTGLLAFINYAKASSVNWTVGLLIMPGVFFGGLIGGRYVQKLSPLRMRRIFAVLLFAVGIWQVVSSWVLAPA
ncbi:MAG TPA: sulfite exporter TauE/SafE family protein [Candidatus Acidoferrales bacterium]|nr:sulfite exporter TauE/SafE family protein [Candidatus Acidoferrales bacterium]